MEVVNSSIININCISNVHYETLSKIPLELEEEKNRQVKFLNISSNYGENPSFMKDSEFNSKNSFKLFPDNPENENTRKKFGVIVSDFVKENWDISVNYNGFNSYSPFVKNTDFTIRDMQCYFIINNANNATYITFPNASDYPQYWNRKEIILKNLHNQPILSKNNDIQQLNSKEISNNILLTESAGKYVSLTTNGKTWVIKSVF